MSPHAISTQRVPKLVARGFPVHARSIQAYSTSSRRRVGDRLQVCPFGEEVPAIEREPDHAQEERQHRCQEDQGLRGLASSAHAPPPSGGGGALRYGSTTSANARSSGTRTCAHVTSGTSVRSTARFAATRISPGNTTPALDWTSKLECVDVKANIGKAVVGGNLLSSIVGPDERRRLIGRTGSSACRLPRHGGEPEQRACDTRDAQQPKREHEQYDQRAGKLDQCLASNACGPTWHTPSVGTASIHEHVRNNGYGASIEEDPSFGDPLQQWHELGRAHDRHEAPRHVKLGAWVGQHQHAANRDVCKPTPSQVALNRRECTLNLRSRVADLAHSIAPGLNPTVATQARNPTGEVLGFDDDHTARPDDHVVGVAMPNKRQIVDDYVVGSELCELARHEVLTRGACSPDRGVRLWRTSAQQPPHPQKKANAKCPLQSAEVRSKLE